MEAVWQSVTAAIVMLTGSEDAGHSLLSHSRALPGQIKGQQGGHPCSSACRQALRATGLPRAKLEAERQGHPIGWGMISRTDALGRPAGRRSAPPLRHRSDHAAPTHRTPANRISTPLALAFGADLPTPVGTDKALTRF
jgi:hypothetical protein